MPLINKHDTPQPKRYVQKHQQVLPMADDYHSKMSSFFSISGDGRVHPAGRNDGIQPIHESEAPASPDPVTHHRGSVHRQRRRRTHPRF